MLDQLSGIVFVLEEELKKIKIFKFKIYLESDGEHLTNTIDQELKNFLSNFALIQRITNSLLRILTNISLRMSTLIFTNCWFTTVLDFQIMTLSCST